MLLRNTQIKQAMKLIVYGKMIEITRENEQWHAYYCGNEGKKRLAKDIIIPRHLGKDELVEYIADICHEWATDRNNKIIKIE